MLLIAASSPGPTWLSVLTVLSFVLSGVVAVTACAARKAREFDFRFLMDRLDDHSEQHRLHGEALRDLYREIERLKAERGDGSPTP